MGPLDHPIEYQQPLQASMHGIERSVCIVGAVHAIACCTYLSARAWPLMFPSPTPVSNFSVTPSLAGILFQFIVAVAALTLCVMRVFWPSRLRRQLVSVAILALGVVWFLFGLMDDFPSWISDEFPNPFHRVMFIFNDFLRELIQLSTPAIVGYAVFAERSRVHVAKVGFVGLLVVCIANIVPSVDQLFRINVWPSILGNETSRAWVITSVVFGVALLLILILRRPWRWVAAMPMLAWIVRDTIVNGETRIDRMRLLPAGEFIVSIVREMSYVTLTATTLLMGVVIFTILGLAKPRIGSRAVEN